MARMGPDDVPGALRVLREIGSGLSYLHDLGAAHGCMAPETVFDVADGAPVDHGLAVGDADRARFPSASRPTSASCRCRTSGPTACGVRLRASDQWQLAATCFAALTGENAAARRSAADPADASRLPARARRHHRSRAER